MVKKADKEGTLNSPLHDFCNKKWNNHLERWIRPGTYPKGELMNVVIK
jgi:hypothetical protein